MIEGRGPEVRRNNRIKTILIRNMLLKKRHPHRDAFNYLYSRPAIYSEKLVILTRQGFIAQQGLTGLMQIRI